MMMRMRRTNTMAMSLMKVERFERSPVDDCLPVLCQTLHPRWVQVHAVREELAVRLPKESINFPLHRFFVQFKDVFMSEVMGWSPSSLKVWFYECWIIRGGGLWHHSAHLSIFVCQVVVWADYHVVVVDEVCAQAVCERPEEKQNAEKSFSSFGNLRRES